MIAVVLNQSDLLTPEQTEDCVSDLPRLLDSEGLHDARVLVTSARTGAGLDELRKVLAETVSERRAATDRIAADLDAMAERFVPYAGEARGAGLDTGDRGLRRGPPGQRRGPGGVVHQGRRGGRGRPGAAERPRAAGRRLRRLAGVLAGGPAARP